MKLDTEMPTLWRDPDSGIYYSNFRIPSDLVSHYNKTHILKSLRTKNKQEAEEENGKRWLHCKNEWRELRQRRSLNAPLADINAGRVREVSMSSIKERGRAILASPKAV